ncbi:hypothetical protein BKA93DRAFT_830439 [Sparassis latifolia]
MAYVSVPFPGGASPMMPVQSFPPVVGSPSPTVSQSQIQPGAITYTTTTGPDGQVTYHPFRAVAASYQTSQGVVSGIQWVPAEATQVLPVGATPATSDIMASFNRQADKEWQREEERRRRKEAERRDREHHRTYSRDDDKDLRRARDKDRERERQRERRLSNTYGSGYSPYDPDRKHSATADLERRFQDLDVDRREREYERERRPSTGFGGGTRSRRNSTYGDRPAGYQPAPGGPYPTPAGAYPPSSTAYASPQSTYSNPYTSPQAPYQKPSPYATPSPRPGEVIPPRPVSPYQGGLGRPVSPYQNPGGVQRPVSPYRNPRPVSPYQMGAIQRAASPRPLPGAYPTTGEGQGIRPSISRVPSPSPYPPPPAMYANSAAAQYGAQYGQGAPQYTANVGYAQGYPAGIAADQQQAILAAPEGFSRPPNLAQPYTHFEIMKIQDMDDFLEVIPRMPLVLVPHDVYHEDWIRLMNDLSLAWSGRLPVPEYARDGRPPKRTNLTTDLIDLWNVSFFLARGVELVLYKGRERRSGRSIGTVDLHLPGFDTYESVSSDDSEDSDDSDDSQDDRYGYGAYAGVYGRQVEGQMAEVREARRVRREKKAEHRKRKIEKKRRQKMKEMERKYSLYLTCTSPREGGLVPQM